MEDFLFASEFSRNPRTTVSFEVNGEPFDIIVPRDGRVIPMVLAVELEDIMEFFSIALDADSADRFEDLVYDMDAGLEMAQLRLVFHHAIGLITGGVPYWVTQRMVSSAAVQWRQFSGEMSRRGIRPFALPLHEFANLVYAWMTEGADRDGRDKFDKEIALPPPGVETEIMAATPEFQNAGNDFLAQMANRGAR